MLTRQFLFAALFIGLIVVVLALIGLLSGAIQRASAALPRDSAITSAWIGFAGSIIGSLITVGVAVVALWPAYRQMGEAQRASSVQAGQILRTRLAATRIDFGILLRGVHRARIIELLGTIKADDSLPSWISHHRSAQNEIVTSIVPSLNETGVKLFEASAGVDLPDLDRGPYFGAVTHIEKELNDIASGHEATRHGPNTLDRDEWQKKVGALLTYLDGDFDRISLAYNNKISLAQQVLRWQIVRADRQAVGPSDYQEFAAIQKTADPDK
jgi:hypothetical protein